MAGVRGKDKCKQKKWAGLDIKQKELFRKKLKATADAKASQRRKQNKATVCAAKHSFIAKMMGPTKNSCASDEESAVNEA